MSVSVLNTDVGLSGKTLDTLESDQTVTGLKTFDRDPNPPFAVTALSAAVANLDADKLDGQEGSYYSTAANLTGALPAISGALLTVLPPVSMFQPTGGSFGIGTAFLGVNTFNSTEATAQGIVPIACVLKNLYVKSSAAPAGSETFIYTLRKNGADTALTCTISAAGTTANDTTHSVTFAAGDTISLKLVGSAGAATATHYAACEITRT